MNEKAYGNHDDDKVRVFYIDLHTVQEIRAIKMLKASNEKILHFFSNTYAKKQIYLQTTTA